MILFFKNNGMGDMLWICEKRKVMFKMQIPAIMNFGYFKRDR
jgi:hypothetical protein